MKRERVITDVAGLDIGKRYLDVGFARSDDHAQFANHVTAFDALLQVLRDHGVTRVGMEASGNYERDIRDALEKAGFEVVVHQPQDIRAFARFRRIKAKSDKIDARLIAKATENWDGITARRDPDLIELADMMTFYEQVARQLAQAKTTTEHHRLKAVVAMSTALIAHLKAAKTRAFKLIQARIRQRPDLIKRFEFLKSIPGIGPVTASILLIRMPELGRLDHGRAASLIGVAPFDHDSGILKGKRVISGGRARPRHFLYIAALAAVRVKTAPFKAFAERLKTKGKPPKVILTAVMRKLIEAANVILKRQSPWTEKPA